MPQLQFGISSYERARGDLPTLPVVNAYAEEAPTEARKVVLQSRPGLVDAGAMGGVAVNALFRRDGVLGGALFGVSGSSLYIGATRLGTVSGEGPLSLAGYENFLFIAGGGSLHGYDGTNLQAIITPDNFGVIKALIAASRLVVIRQDTGQFYWSGVLETDLNALDFATAENQPDRLLDALFVDDTLLLFGAETIEWWANTRDSDLPFSPIEGRVIERGIRATGCASQIGSSFAWVTNHNEVCLGSEDGVISTPGLQARIAASETVRLFTFDIDGMDFLALRLDAETQVWNRRSGTWSEFASHGQSNWIAQCHAGGVFGSAIDGRVLKWGDGHTDLGGVLERRFRAGLAMDGGGVRVNNLRLRCNVGQSPFLTGPYAEPEVEMRLSDDGQTWSEWEAESLGEQGDYEAQPEWRALGMASYPGLLCEFRVTDPVDFRVSDVLVNEERGGR